MPSHGLTQDAHDYASSIGREVWKLPFPRGNANFSDSHQMYQYLCQRGDLINPSLCTYLSLGNETGGIFVANVMVDAMKERPHLVDASKRVFWQCVNRAIAHRDYLAPYLAQEGDLETRVIQPSEFDFYATTSIANWKDGSWFTVPAFLEIYAGLQLNADALLPRYIEPLKYDEILFTTRKSVREVFSAICSLQEQHLFDGGTFVGITKQKPMENGLTQYTIYFDRTTQSLLYPWKEYRQDAVIALSKALRDEVVIGLSCRDYQMDAFVDGSPAGKRVAGEVVYHRPNVSYDSKGGASFVLTDPKTGLTAKLLGVCMDQGEGVWDVPVSSVDNLLLRFVGAGTPIKTTAPAVYYPPYIKTTGPER